MATIQPTKEELSDINREREDSRKKEESSPAVVQTIIRSVQGTMEHAKEAVIGKSQDAGEYKDYTAEKAKEGKDTTVGKMAEYKDYAAEKAKQGKDATVEKAKEGKDSTLGKMGELKESAAEVAKRASEFLTGKKEETKKTVEETGKGTEETKEAAKGKYQEAKEEAARKMEELKLSEHDMVDRNTAVGGGIVGAIGSVKDKLMPQSKEGEDEGSRVSYGSAPEPKTGRRLGVDDTGAPVVVEEEDAPLAAVEPGIARVRLHRNR